MFFHEHNTRQSTILGGQWTGTSLSKRLEKRKKLHLTGEISEKPKLSRVETAPPLFCGQLKFKTFHDRH
jgi:hypothetical protein